MIRDRVRRAILWLRAFGADALDLFRASPEIGLPPRRRRLIVGAGDFVESGRHLASLLTEHAGLTADTRALDLGCGWGRAAIPLTQIITEGEYAGVDVQGDAVDWCRGAISTMNPRFRFEHLDLRNDYYNPHGTQPAAPLPWDDQRFEVVFAFSLFTHLAPPMARHYFAESARLLVPGGRFLFTHFVTTPERIGQARHCPNAPLFEHSLAPGYRTANLSNPEAAVAIDESHLEQELRSARFREIRILPGAWYCREDWTTYQDLVVAVRPPDHASEA